MEFRYLIGVLLVMALAGCSGDSAPEPGDDQGLPETPEDVALFAEDRIIVQIEEDDPEKLDEILRDLRGVDIERIGASSFFVLHLPPGEKVQEFAKHADADVRVLEVGLDYRSSAPEGGPSDAPILGSDLIDSIPAQMSLLPLGLPGAHTHSTGAGTIVAVVDTGIDPGHPFLAGRIAPGGFDFIDGDPDPIEERNFVDDDRDGRVDDQFGHGTFVASLVLAAAPDARILPIRALDDEGYGNASTVASAIYWAVERGARVINVSVDIEMDPHVVADAIDFAKANDVVVVAAAGNSGLPDVVFPARYSEVVAVAATDADGVVAPFSNFGSAIDLSAPGVAMLGAVPAELNASGTALWSGTSFATPLVSGVAALLCAVDPGLRPEEVLQRLQAAALPLDDLNPVREGELGAGLVRADVALMP